MASILVIVATFLGGSVIELGKCFAEPIKHRFNYLCCFKKNVRTLENESKQLEGARADLQLRVDTDERNAQVVDSQVQTWFEKVSVIQEEMHGITTKINGGSVVGSRFSLGKKVKKTAKDMKKLRLQSGNFNTVSQPPPPAASVSIPLRSTFEFESRKKIEEEIIADLKDNKANVFGICGMGGVGKTTMAKRIMNRAREELGFEEIVMAVVSQEVDMLGIQDDIAKSLGLEFEKESTLSSKGHKLRTRLTASKNKSLVVIDDIWENVNLEELGIPCNGDGGCKILLTSRDRDVLKRMPAVDKVHAVLVLSETEAWDLFKSKVGSCIEQENVASVAQQVVKECKGLPIALVTVGTALKDTESTSVWEGWLQQLKSSNPTDLPVVLNDVYKPLKLSYNFLTNGREKSLFLLCCLFPEDHNIPVESLVIYAMGLGLFEDTTSLKDARNRVSLLVEMLKGRFLLQEGSEKNKVKMHDVIRDVGIYIASDEKRINCNDSAWISPNTREGIKASTSFPNLNLLLINRESRDKNLEIDDHFFERMMGLKVFSIRCWSLQQLPQTINLLKNLRTLILEYCSFIENISEIGKLVNLEVFICWGCERIESLPVEMGRLSRLKLLEFSWCSNLKTIAPGIISNLKELEELIVEEFGNWESEITGIKGKNASLSELQHLSNLTRLKIQINDSILAAERIRLPQRYDITIGCVRRDFYFKDKGIEKIMILKLEINVSLPKWIDLSFVECMCVEGDGSRYLDFGVANNMRWLSLKKCSTVKKLVNLRATATVFPLLETLQLEEVSELEEICDIDGPYQQKPVSIFNKLSFVLIFRCDKLRSLFSLSILRASLARLERLEIRECEMMEQVFSCNETESQKNIIHFSPLVFPKLKLLSLESLPGLRSFCEGVEIFEFPV